MGLLRSTAMRVAFLSFLFFAGCSGGCGGGAPSTARTHDPDRSPEGASGSSAPHTAAAGATPSAVDPAPPPELSVELVEGDVLRVRNVGDHAVSLRGAVKLETRRGEAWADAPLAFSLRASCDTPAPTCVDLAPGGELLPPAWLGTQGDAQCACERCVQVEGEVRFVVESCAPEGHAPHRVESAPLRR